MGKIYFHFLVLLVTFQFSCKNFEADSGVQSDANGSGYVEGFREKTLVMIDELNKTVDKIDLTFAKTYYGRSAAVKKSIETYQETLLSGKKNIPNTVIGDKITRSCSLSFMYLVDLQPEADAVNADQDKIKDLLTKVRSELNIAKQNASKSEDEIKNFKNENFKKLDGLKSSEKQQIKDYVNKINADINQIEKTFAEQYVGRAAKVQSLMDQISKNADAILITAHIAKDSEFDYADNEPFLRLSSRCSYLNKESLILQEIVAQANKLNADAKKVTEQIKDLRDITGSLLNELNKIAVVP